MVSPVLAQASSLMRGKESPQLADLLFLFSPLLGTTMCSPDQPTTIPAAMKDNPI